VLIIYVENNKKSLRNKKHTHVSYLPTRISVGLHPCNIICKITRAYIMTENHGASVDVELMN
jgi:hypothetical protein